MRDKWPASFYRKDCDVSHIKTAAAYAGAIAAGFFFGAAIGGIDPFDDGGQQEISGIAAWVLFVAAFSRMGATLRWAWIAYGMLTFTCFMTADILFWSYMSYDTWLPPHPDIVHRITRLSGETSSEAHISEIFLEFWLIPTAAFIAFALLRRMRRVQTRA
jgi:hypothetical protein